MTTPVRVVVAVVWVAGLAGLTQWSLDGPATLAAGVTTVLAGALIGRWWALILPLAPAAILIGIELLGRGGTADEDGITGYLWAVAVAGAALVIVALLAVGVTAGEPVSMLWRRLRAHPGPG